MLGSRLVALVAMALLGACNGKRDEAGAAKPAAIVAEAPAGAKSRAKPEMTRRPQPHAPLEQFVQPHAERLGADLARVGGAHGRQPIRVQEAGLQEAEATFAQVAGIQVAAHRVQPGILHRRRRKHALITQVMDGEDGARAAEQPVPRVERLQVQRDQRGLPVVAVPARDGAQRR